MEIDSIHVSSEVYDVDGDWWDTREAVFSKPEDIRKLLEVLKFLIRHSFAPS